MCYKFCATPLIDKGALRLDLVLRCTISEQVTCYCAALGYTTVHKSLVFERSAVKSDDFGPVDTLEKKSYFSDL